MVERTILRWLLRADTRGERTVERNKSSGRVGLALTGAYWGTSGEKRTRKAARFSSSVTTFTSSTTDGTCAQEAVQAPSASSTASNSKDRRAEARTATVSFFHPP
jgi:hypothetical protein